MVREIDIGVRAWTFVKIRPRLCVTDKLVVTFWTLVCEALPHRRKVI